MRHAWRQRGSVWRIPTLLDFPGVRRFPPHLPSLARSEQTRNDPFGKSFTKNSQCVDGLSIIGTFGDAPEFQESARPADS